MPRKMSFHEAEVNEFVYEKESAQIELDGVSTAEGFISLVITMVGVTRFQIETALVARFKKPEIDCDILWANFGEQSAEIGATYHDYGPGSREECVVYRINYAHINFEERPDQRDYTGWPEDEIPPYARPGNAVKR